MKIWRNADMYEPKPIDTSDVILPEGLLSLTEKIAENVHDVWAAGRISEGWSYGAQKDAEKKITPLLVPYHELPESEKEYDRKTALETIKLIVKMGYHIAKPLPNK
ncbi:MAG: Ryanodine receptor Ryr [Lachnospiraceae bacterium]|nr:Ryanodine receptor Ryr [Lachnospiraceae bacterium]